MKNLILPLFAIAFTISNAQTTTAGFENFDLQPESFLNGSDLSGGFGDGAIFLPNDYNTDFSSWSGWAITNKSDNTTPGFTNQYSAITGQGLNSDTYATGYVSGESVVRLENGASQEGVYITNSTYAYFSMLDGDSFSKKFGGLTGNDPDFFLLTIQAYSGGELMPNEVEFYLADFTFTDNSQDYIVDEWTYVDLSSLGAADSLSFTLTSSDVGEFGMNTPAYFCIDDFITNNLLSTRNEQEALFQVYPNPTTDRIRISGESIPELISVFDVNGRLVLQEKNVNEINLENLQTGTYILQALIGGVVSSQSVVKR
ncbi:DUF4465 domain-containing protein [Cryomorphaceae bacterium 1068]|nr:DUF4465 domain-containing protein [Cryomorphaceae bacterium 1068]